MPNPEDSLFERSVAVCRTAEGRYAATVEAAWSGPVSPNGGVLAATMLRAAAAELGPEGPPPRTVSAHYLEAPRPGEAQLAVETLRRGKRVAAADVRMHQDGRLVCQATIVFSAARSTPLALPSAPLTAAPPQSLPPLHADAMPRVFGQLELRPAFGPPVFSRGAEAVTGGWMALRDDRAPLDPARLCAMCDLWWPAVFSTVAGPVGVPTIELTVYLRSVERTHRAPVLARFESRRAAEGHVEETGALWSADGELLAESHQLALLLAMPSA